jgi:plastocyanin
MGQVKTITILMTISIISVFSMVSISSAQISSSPSTVSPQGNTTIQNNSQSSIGPNSTNLTGSIVTISTGVASAGAAGPCLSANNCFNPHVISVNTGANVTWMNKDNVIHTVTSGKSTDTDSGKLFDKNIPSGKSISIQFTNPGTIDYFCKVHPWMTGQVLVGSNSSNTNVQGGIINSSNTTNSGQLPNQLGSQSGTLGSQGVNPNTQNSSGAKVSPGSFG